MDANISAGAVVNMRPTRKWLIAQVKKKFWKRVSWLSVWAIIGLLIDEYAKEGYILNPADLTNPFAHEFWIAVLAVVGVVSAYISEKREAEDEGRS